MKIQMLLAAVLLITACKKEHLDISSGDCFAVEALLDSRNADVGCGNTADFEEKTLCLSGTLEEGSALHHFVLRDTKHSGSWIEVQLDSVIASEVAELVRNNAGKTATVKGIIHGFDKPQNLKCRRGYFQQMSAVNDLEIE